MSARGRLDTSGGVGLLFWFGLLATVSTVGCGGEPTSLLESMGQSLRAKSAAASSTQGGLEILPGDVSVEAGVPVQFIARMASASGAGILNSRIKWKVSGGKSASIDDTGRFEATTDGTYTVMASSNDGYSAQTTVNVGSSGPITALMAVNSAGDPSFDPSLDAAVRLRQNRRGPDPRDAAQIGRPQPGTGPRPMLLPAGLSDYTFDLPLLKVPGRGLDLDMTLHYSANVWTINGAEADFDIDGDWPAPGFTLSFGKLVDTGAGILFIDGNGTRHSYGCTTCTMRVPAVTYSGYTTDGTLIDYTFRWSANGNPSTGTLFYPDGTRIDFGAGGGGGALYATKITDRNGNFITITYLNNRGPQLSAVLDTVGRSTTFNYFNGNLQEILTPGVNGGIKQAAFFHYSTVAIATLFHSPITTVVVNGAGAGGTRYLLDAVFLTDKSGISMGTSASLYSQWGMIRQIDQRVGMSVDARGNIIQGTLKRYTTYNFPATTVPDPGFTKAPSYSSQSDYWVNNDNGVVSTTYSMTTSGGVVTTTVTRPDGSKIVRRASDDQAAPEYGLTTQIQELSNTSSVLRQTDYSYVKVYRGAAALKESLVQYFGASAPAPLRTVYTYNAGNTDTDLITSQIQRVDEYDYDKTTVLRSTVYSYVSNSSYVTNHIYNLLSAKVIGPGSVERYDYVYDTQRGTDFRNTPGVTQHSAAYDPYGSSYQPISDFRGNLVTVTRYSNPSTLSGAVTSGQWYDMTGNPIWQQTEFGVQTSMTYGSSYQYAYLTAATTGLSPNSYDTTTTYDLGTGAPVTVINPANAATTLFYNASTQRIDHMTTLGSLQVNFRFDDLNFTRTVETVDSANPSVVFSRRITTVNGLDLPTQTSDLSDAAGTVDLVRMQYDGLGRQSRRSLPYRAGDAVVYTTYAFDGLGRRASVTGPDGAVSTWTYQPSFVPSGQPGIGITVLEKNAWQAERWLRYDALGSMAASYEAKNTTGPKASVSNGGVLTSWRYDVRGLLVFAYSAGAASHVLAYDGLGNPTCQVLSERTRTLGADGTYRGYTVQFDGTLVGQGVCSDVNKYDTSGRIISSIDARGIETKIDYGTDPLSRIQGISYDTSHFGDTAHPVVAAASTTYTYCTVGDANCPHRDVRLVRRETTSGVVTRDFAYDSYGRGTQIVSTINGRTGSPLAINTAYDRVGRLAQLTYPTRYGFANTSRRVIGYDLDAKGRITRLSMDGVAYAQGLTYGASGGMTNAVLGPSGGYQGTEIWDYEPNSGLLARQRVQVGAPATTKMDLQYGYLLPGADGSLGRTGKLTSVVNGQNSARNRSYTYDSLGRLRAMTSGTTASPWSETYGYDDVGNRTSVTAGGGAVLDGLSSLSFTYDKRVQGWEYDPAGNLIQGNVGPGNVERFQYDAAGRLISVTRVGSPNVLLETYTYGADRVRLSMTDGSGTKTYYVTDGQHPLAEYSDNGSSLVYARTYLYLGERLIAALKPSGSTESLEVYHYDRLGRRIIGTTTSTKEQVTLPFGTELDAEATTWTRHEFMSYERSDTTRLDYAINRFYSSGQSRFTQVDPLGGGILAEGWSQSLNLYSFVGNDPVNALDPTGLRWELIGRNCTNITVIDGFGPMGSGGGCTEVYGWVSDSVPYSESGGRTGGGGGGAGGNSRARTSDPKLDKGVKNAKKRMAEEPCQSLFGAASGKTIDSINALDSMLGSGSFSVGSKSPTGRKFDPREGGASIGRYPDATTIINSEGPYFTGNPNFDREGTAEYRVFPTDFQGLIILHELLHDVDLKGQYDDYRGNPAGRTSPDVTRTVLKACPGVE